MLKLVKNIQRRDIQLTSQYLSKTPFHTAYWVHRRIRQAIIENSHLAKGVLLDVGCGVKPYKSAFAPFVEKHLGIEYSTESGFFGNLADFCADAAALPLPDASVDTILCTEVLEHVPDPEKVISEFARILRNDGVVICTAPFFYPVHDKFDFFRYSPTGLAAIMKRHDLIIEKVEPLSGSGMTVAIMTNLFLFDLGFLWTKWLYPIGLILRPVLWLLIFLINLLGWVLEKVIPSDQMSFNHLTVARAKQGNDSALLEE
ncbi:hypothetical protein BH20ACI1_BH20ACI1_20290 [soil metagenome]